MSHLTPRGQVAFSLFRGIAGSPFDMKKPPRRVVCDMHFRDDQARLESTALKVWLGHITALSLLLSGR